MTVGDAHKYENKNAKSKENKIRIVSNECTGISINYVKLP